VPTKAELANIQPVTGDAMSFSGRVVAANRTLVQGYNQIRNEIHD